MKQPYKYNDEELFQQIMEELKPGAEEYDRFLAEGKNPASKRKIAAPIYKYVAAACIGFAFIGTSLYMLTNGEGSDQQPVAEVTKPITIEENKTFINTEAKTPTVALNSSGKASKPKMKHVKTDEDTTKNISSDAEVDEREQEFLYALITEVENNVLTEQMEEELLYNSIIDEVTANLVNDNDKYNDDDNDNDDYNDNENDKYLNIQSKIAELNL